MSAVLLCPQSRGLNSAVKRASWAPTEIRVDQLLQKLRSHLSQNRYKHSSPSSPSTVDRLQRSDVPMTSSDLETLTQLLLDATPSDGRKHQKVASSLQADLALLELLRSADRPDVRARVAMLRMAAARPEPEVGDPDIDGDYQTWSQLDDSDSGRSGATKRAGFAGAAEIRSARDIHPVYLGMGQSAASAALNTYASLLADDKRRESSDQYASSNPVRFIGKR